MYSISHNAGYLLVEFVDDIDFFIIQTAIHQETMLREYAGTNDIWLIGHYRVAIRLDDLERLATEFQCRCPRNATRTKTAIVVNEGLTGAIIELWVKGVRTKVPFAIEIFRTLHDAKCWLGIEDVNAA